MNFYKVSPFSHSLKVLNEPSVSCSNKNIIYKAGGNCLITREGFIVAVSFFQNCAIHRYPFISFPLNEIIQA